MKKKIIPMILCAAVLMTACGAEKNADSASPSGPAETETSALQEESGQSAEGTTTEGSSASTRKDGERFEDVIMLEGMEETVRYEHAVNEEIGFEMDFDYESLKREREDDRERFVSIYDDNSNPDNYLEVTYRPESSREVVDSVRGELSKEYDIITDTIELAHAGSCTTIDASADVSGTVMPDRLQKVYIIPAGEGTVVATAHYSSEAAEGFGHRFGYMVNTLAVIDRQE